jgi:hypothetical protein
VLRGGPVGGGGAWLTRNPFQGESSCAYSGPGSGDERVPVAPDGLFRFVAVEPGTYCVGVDIEPGLRRMRSLEVVAGTPTRRWVITLGDAEIRGHVLRAGAPAGDLAVRCQGMVKAGTALSGADEARNALALTDADGAYRLRGLEPGAYAVEALFGDHPHHPDNRALVVELGPSEVETVDFGGLPVWSGRVLGASGAPHRGSLALVLENPATGTSHVVRPGSDGAFRAELVPGTYLVKAHVMRESRELERIVVGEQGLEHDVRLPAAWVRVTVRYVGTKPQPNAELAQLMVFLSKRAERGSAAMAAPGHDGEYHFFGVPPGEYELSATTSPIAGRPPRATLPLVVREGELEIPVELALGDL